MRFVASVIVVFVLSGGLVRGQVVASEFFSDPVSEGWGQLQQFCEPEVSNEGGLYHQVLDFEACGPPPGGGQDSWVVQIDSFDGVANWSCEFRVQTTGEQSEITGGAPTVRATGNSFGELYRTVVARDLVQLLRDVDLPILFIELEPGVPHRFRVELNNVGTPTYRWYIDGVLIDAGIAEDVFPSDNSGITRRGKAWFLPTENWWDDIGYGVPAEAHSEDYDSSVTVTPFDFFYFAECVADRGNGPETPVDPGCEFADMDADGDVHFADFRRFQLGFAGDGGQRGEERDAACRSRSARPSSSTAPRGRRSFEIRRTGWSAIARHGIAHEKPPQIGHLSRWTGANAARIPVRPD